MLEINPLLVLLTAVVFLGLIAILNSVLYKPLLGFIESRNAAIRNDEESVGKNTSDLSVHEAEIEQIILNARSEAAKIKQEAMNEAKDAAMNLVSKKRLELESDYEAFIQNLQLQKSEFKADLLNKLPDLKNVLKSKLAKI